MNQELDTYITRAKEIYSEPHGSTKYELWKHDVRNYIEAKFGSDLLAILDRALRPSRVFTQGDNLQLERNKRMERAVEFLEELKSRDASNDLATSQGKSIEQVKRDVQARLSKMNITIAGNATFGDNSPLYQIEIGEFLAALTQEIETMPESSEKQRLLQQLKAITENPTFAAIAGGAVGSIVQRLVG